MYDSRAKRQIFYLEEGWKAERKNHGSPNKAMQNAEMTPVSNDLFADLEKRMIHLWTLSKAHNVLKSTISIVAIIRLSGGEVTSIGTQMGTDEA
jgi:hypothetical protein